MNVFDRMIQDPVDEIVHQYSHLEFKLLNAWQWGALYVCSLRINGMAATDRGPPGSMTLTLLSSRLSLTTASRPIWLLFLYNTLSRNID